MSGIGTGTTLEMTGVLNSGDAVLFPSRGLCAFDIFMSSSSSDSQSDALSDACW
jgi:hypothetical protein